MISSYEVGAIFRIGDDATPVLRRIAAELRSLNTEIVKTKSALEGLGKGIPFARMERGFGMLNTEMGKLAKSSDDLAANMTLAFGVMNTEIRSLIGSMSHLSGQMRGMGGASAGGAAGGGGASGRPSIRRGGGGGGRSNLPHLSGNVPLGGGLHARYGGTMGSIAGMGVLGAIGYGMYEEAEVEDIAARALMTGQIKVDEGMTQTSAFSSLRGMIQRTSSQTGFSPKAVGEAVLTTERQFGGLSFADRMKIEETLIPFAAAEARMKETTLPEAFESMVSLAHMSGTYDSKQLPELMRQFQYASMITPVPIEQFQRAISYSLPMLHAGLDMDPSSVMFLTAMTQTAGITNTKSGTWLRSFFENAEPRVGPSLSKQAVMHNEALQRMGLLDDRGGVTWQVKDSAGKTDWDASIIKMSEAINKFTKATDPASRLSTLRTAFGERGGGFASLMNLSQFIEQFPVLQEKMKAFRGGEDVLTSLTKGSPVQAGRNAWADLQNVLMDIGTVALPPVIAGLKQLDEYLKKIKAGIDSPHPSAAPVVGAAGAGAVVGFMIGGPVGAGVGAVGLGGTEAYFQLDKSFQSPLLQYPIPQSWTAGDPWVGNQEAILKRARDSADEFRRDPEAVRGRALGRLSSNTQINVSIPNVSLTSNIKVMIDGKVIAAAVEHEVLPAIMRGVASELHSSNLTNQGEAGTSLDAAHAAGLGAN